MKNTIGSLMLAAVTLMGCKTAIPENVAWKEVNRMLVIEAEDGDFPEQTTGWKKENKYPGYTGSGYVIWRGESNWGPESKSYDSIPTGDVISYKIRITNPGLYYVKVLNYHLKEDGDNDVWTSVDKGDWGKTYDWQVNSWTLDERSEWAKYRLEKGDHLVEIAGRSPGFAIDQIVLYEQSLKNNPPIGTDSAQVP